MSPDIFYENIFLPIVEVGLELYSRVGLFEWDIHKALVYSIVLPSSLEDYSLWCDGSSVETEEKILKELTYTPFRTKKLDQVLEHNGWHLLPLTSARCSALPKPIGSFSLSAVS